MTSALMCAIFQHCKWNSSLFALNKVIYIVPYQSLTLYSNAWQFQPQYLYPSMYLLKYINNSKIMNIHNRKWLINCHFAGFLLDILSRLKICFCLHCSLYEYSYIEHIRQQFFVFWICCHTLNFTFYIISDTDSNFVGK